jgi:acetyl-CoA carboxylase biotin carboxyl carrier protein
MPKKTKQGKAPRSEKQVDLAEVERVLAFMNKHGLEEFEYEREGVRIRLKKPSAVARDYPRSAPPELSRGSRPSAPAPPPAAEPAKAEDLHVIKSPIVGTFYAAAGPDAAPFVTVGAAVGPGQVLCIIEAMKLMNEIESDISGAVAKIFAENGSPVEYGQPLFGIRPAAKK